MSAPFVALVLSYCLGRGQIDLRGRKCRPWLEIRRPETQRPYIDHQLRRLRKLHDGPVEAALDLVSTELVYDDFRMVLHAPELWRCYELLYPRDEFTISQEVLDIVGRPGLLALWCDQGRWKGPNALLSIRRPEEEMSRLAEWIRGLGYSTCLLDGAIGFERSTLRQFQKDMREIIHPSMRHTLRPDKR